MNKKKIIRNSYKIRIDEIIEVLENNMKSAKRIAEKNLNQLQEDADDFFKILEGEKKIIRVVININDFINWQLDDSDLIDWQRIIEKAWKGNDIGLKSNIKTVKDYFDKFGYIPSHLIPDWNWNEITSRYDIKEDEINEGDLPGDIRIHWE